MTLSVCNHNARLQTDNFLDPQIYSKDFVINKLDFDRKFTFIDRVSQFSTVGGGQDDYARVSWHTFIDVVAKPTVL